MGLAGKPAVPEGTDLVVIAGPRASFVPPELEMLAAFVERGGRLLVMLDPTMAQTGRRPRRHGPRPLQRELLDARVVVLGAGGLGSSVIQNLAGLGVSELTILDFDTVELQNFARQFVYTEEQLGQPKAEQVAAWLRRFDPGIDVQAVNGRVTGPDDVRVLLPGADLVISAIDDPDEVDLWVNEACVGEGIPFIRGGLSYTQGLYWSVDPGRSACRQCLESYRATFVEDIDLPLLTWSV